MTFRSLVADSLRYYWRTHLAVVAGVAIAVSVLAGALLVGDSVRASLRRLVDERLGRATLAVTSQGFFRDELDEALSGQAGFDGSFSATVSLIALEGALVHQPSGRQASQVQVYGVDDRFFALHGRIGVEAPRNRSALLSPALAAELGVEVDSESMLLRVRKPSAIPTDTIQGRRTDISRSIVLTYSGTLAPEDVGDFSLRPQQDAVRAVFVPLSRLQRDLDLPSRANLLLIAGGPDEAGPAVAAAERLLERAATFEDLGLKLTLVEAQHAWSLESETGLLPDGLIETAPETLERQGYSTLPVFTYLANSIRKGGGEIPYSVVTDVDPRLYERRGPPVPEPDSSEGQIEDPDEPPLAIPEAPHPPIWLNEWAAEDLGARPGDEITLDYYLWSDEAGLTTDSATFSMVGTVPMSGAGGDARLTPDYPGLTDANRIGDWDPPFPVDLDRIRASDEEYWDRYRAAPKAFVTSGRELWASRHGSATSLRVYVPEAVALDSARTTIVGTLRRHYSPATAGVIVQPVRAQALAASQGATDFGEYFVYFSFFIVVSGLLLTGLFFKLGLEQRAREVGLLFALGFTARQVRWHFLRESVVLAVAGALLGMLGAVAFAALIMYGLRTWWVEAVGTTRLALAVSPATLVAGAAGGVIVALVALFLTLRRLGTSSPRDLLSGLALMADRPSSRRLPSIARSALVRLLAGLVAAVALVAAAWAGWIGDVAAFFAAGGIVLLSALAAASAWFRAPAAGVLHGHGWAAVSRLGARQTTARPGRSVLSIALIAFATFVIVAVGAFRRGAPEDAHAPSGGTGGYALFAESVAPVLFDPNSREGRFELGISPDDPSLSGVIVRRFRLRPGEDGSCLNLYRPTSPRIVAPSPAFVDAGRFSFASTLAETDAERRNPWVLLDRRFPDGAIPVIGDANSLQYVLHVPVGGDFLLPGGPGGEPVVLRVVAALSDSLFQSELIVSEGNFQRLYPRLEGYRFFVIEAPRDRETEVATTLEDALADYGFDVRSSAERLASYHRVENTYLSTFQALGGLGLLLGTLGLGAVLLRNVLERRRELALLQAVGYRRDSLGLMVVAESVLLLVAGVAIGTLSALLAIAPALGGRGTHFPVSGTVLVLAGVIATGLVASFAAARVAARSPLLASLRAE